jgi:opacity protein-like surface antigen
LVTLSEEVTEMKRLIVLTTLLVGLPLAASAGEWYIGAGVGASHVESANFYSDIGYTTDTFKANDVGWLVFTGYQLSDHIAAELEYMDFGSLKDDSYCAGCKVNPHAVNIMAVGSLPIAGNFEAFGKIGLALLSVKASCDTCGGTDGAASNTESSEDLALGFGIGYKWGPVKIRVEYDMVNAEDTDSLRLIGVTGSYGFKF